MSKKTDEYLIELPRENAIKLAELATAAGYHDDCQYLADVVNGVIEGRYKPIEENETDGT